MGVREEESDKSQKVNISVLEVSLLLTTLMLSDEAILFVFSFYGT